MNLLEVNEMIKKDGYLVSFDLMTGDFELWHINMRTNVKVLVETFDIDCKPSTILKAVKADMNPTQLTWLVIA